MGISQLAGVGLLAACAVGCMPVGNYHSAKTLPRGESAWGLTFSATTYEDPDDGSQTTIPGIIPEFTYHVGLTDDFEMGGRIAPGFLFGEIDAKYRLVHTPQLHLALAPAIGQAAIGVMVTTLRLPIVITVELNEQIAINIAGVVGQWRVDCDSADECDDLPFVMADDTFTTAGTSVSFEIRGVTTYFRPQIEWTRAVIGTGDEREEAFQMVQAALHFAFVSGRELKKLEQMDERLKRIEENTSSWKNRFVPKAARASD